MVEERKGQVFKLGDNVSTDLIYPGQFMDVVNPHEMARHALKGISDDFPNKLTQNCFIVAGTNFGCGSSREQAATCMKYAGVSAVIAKGFARIFFRNAINQGLPVIVCPDVVNSVADGETITVDFINGKIHTQGGEYNFAGLPSFIVDIIESGGLINYTLKTVYMKNRGRNG